MSEQPKFEVGQIVSFCGTFGMRRFTTRIGKIIYIKDNEAQVECKQGVHRVYLSQLTLRKDQQK